MYLGAAGDRPTLASFEVQEQAQRSTLAALAGGVLGLTSGVYNLAVSARSHVVTGPRMLTQGTCAKGG